MNLAEKKKSPKKTKKNNKKCVKDKVDAAIKAFEDISKEAITTFKVLESEEQNGG